jgi:transcriptional regulator with XRE-family HTH domain
MEAGLSLARLGEILHYSKGHLSKVENGAKSPSPELARLSDAALGAKGALVSLASGRPSGTALPEAVSDEDEVWLMSLSIGGDGWFHPMDRREALTLTTSSLLGFGLSGRGVEATARQPTAVEVFRTMLEQARNLGQTASPGVVLPTAIAQTHALRALALQAPASLRDDFLVLGARFAEYAGWMAQEAGDPQGALWWTAKAVDMAAAGGDHDLAVYALVRRALVTLYREDAPQTIELARQAQVRKDVPRRIRGLAAQREAQGHALACDYDACMRSLDEARELLGGGSDRPEASVLGTTNLTDPVSMVTGWCLYELGQPKQASEILDREVARIPPRALRSRARYGVRQALAHAAAGEVERACSLTVGLLAITDVVASATIVADLRRLARVLSRWHGDPAVRELYPALTAAVRSPEV